MTEIKSLARANESPCGCNHLTLPSTHRPLPVHLLQVTRKLFSDDDEAQVGETGKEDEHPGRYPLPSCRMHLYTTRLLNATYTYAHDMYTNLRSSVYVQLQLDPPALTIKNTHVRTQ